MASAMALPLLSRPFLRMRAGTGPLLGACTTVSRGRSTAVLAASAGPEEPLKYPIPPFTEETAREKVKAAQDAWNTKNPQKVSLAYTPDSQWHNRDLFFSGRDEIVKFLTKKWEMELDYRLVKELWTYNGNRIAVRFEYEFHDESGQWFRAHGNENWDFDERGYMQIRDACINNVPIDQSVRRLKGWEIHDAK